jgi:prepilin-type N-terminal cleavage/methylation domain-containing protein
MIMTRNSKQPMRAAFTLIEMLAAMAILVVLILFLGRVVAESSTVWSAGARRTEMNVWGRAAMDFITRDISAMIADDVIRFEVKSDVDEAFGFDADRIHFLSLNQTSESGRRTASAIIYYIRPMVDPVNNERIPRRYRLTRNAWVSVPQITAYTGNVNPSIPGDLDWTDRAPQSGTSDDVAENIRTFEVFAYDYNFEEHFDYSNMTPNDLNGSQSFGPPLWVDVYMEVFSQSDAERAADLGRIYGERNRITTEYVRRNVQRFAVRVFPHNSTGYNRPNEFYPHYEPYRDEFVWSAVDGR